MCLTLMLSVTFLESRKTRFQLKKDISTELFDLYRYLANFFEKNLFILKESLVKTSPANVEKFR